MITATESLSIARALTTVAKNHADRFRVRFSGGADSHFYTANDENAKCSGFVCPQQLKKTATCGSCGILCALSTKNVTFLGHAKPMKVDHPSIINGTTKFANSKLTNLDPMKEKTALKASSNAKLGKKVLRGAWKGAEILTLTLTERETCPVTCEHWNDCYGNNMHLAKRLSTVNLMEAIERDLNNLNPAKQYVVRLHVLGDFYSVEYVEFWNRMLDTYSNIKIFGYTAHAINNDHLRKVA
jgi:hypothetical protein